VRPIQRRTGATWLVCAIACFAASAGASGLDELHAFLEGTKTAQGSFRQVVVNREGRTTQTTSGTFAFARPGKFRWTYDKPFDQLIVGDGDKVWVYDHDLNQVIVRKLDVALGANPAALLAGDNALEKNCDLAEAGTNGGLDWIAAKPKAPDSGFEYVRIGFRDNLPRAMELTDTFGQITTLTFVTIERNPTLPPTLFRFETPAGADVVGDAAAK